MRRKYIYTLITSFFVLASQLLAFRLAANVFGKEGFGEYALSRRIVAFILLPLLLGLGVSIPRYIALSGTARLESNQADSYFTSGLCLGIPVIFLFLVAVNLLSEEFAYFSFGDSKYSYMVWPLSVSVFGLYLHSLVYSYFRGHLKMDKANTVEIVNHGIIPLSVFALPNLSISNLFQMMGFMWTIISVCMGVMIFRKMEPHLSKINKETYNKACELFQYGLTRIPGEFGLVGLFSLPAIWVAHFVDIERAGFVSFGLSLVTLMGSLSAPIGIILLPETSRMIAARELDTLRKILVKLFNRTMGLALVATLFLEFFMPAIVTVGLGREFSEATSTVRVILLGGIPYTVYTILRNFLDAASIKALNTKNLVTSLFVFLAISFLGNSYNSVLIGVCMGLLLLGCLTAMDSVKTFKNLE